MKVICVEEHTGDQDLLKAGQPKQKAEASYFTEVGTDFKGSLDDGDDKLPSTLNFQSSAKLLPDRDGGRLAIMDQHGIEMQILSYSNPSQYVPADQQLELTRQANDRLAESVRANSTRFGGFACLPWGHPEAAAEELERTVKELGFVGTLLIGRPGDTFLDDPRYAPILAKLSSKTPLAKSGSARYVPSGPDCPMAEARSTCSFGQTTQERQGCAKWPTTNRNESRETPLTSSRGFVHNPTSL